MTEPVDNSLHSEHNSSAADSVFDQSRETQSKKFEAFLHDTAKIQEVIEWNQRATKLLQEVGFKLNNPDEGQGMFIGFFHEMLGNLDESIFGEGLISEQLSDKVLSVLRENPSTALNAPQLEIVNSETWHSFPKTQMQDDARPDHISSFFIVEREVNQPYVNEDETKLESELTISKAVEIKEIEQTFGLLGVSYAEAAIISQVCQKIEEIYKETSYWFFALQEARKIILTLCPDLQEVDDEVIAKTVLVNPNWTFLSGVWAASAEFNNFYIIQTRTRTIERKNQVGHDHAELVLVLCHEYLHLLVAQMLQKYFSTPKFNVNNKILARRKERIEEATLSRTILEGVSVTFEQFEMAKFTQTLQQEEDASPIRDFSELRRKSLRNANRLLNNKHRQRVSQEIIDKGGPPLTRAHQFPEISYSEGIRVAIALRNNGWTPKDLPVLVDEIVKIIRNTTSAKSYADLGKIKLTKNENSLYMKIVRQIKELKLSKLDSPQE